MLRPLPYCVHPGCSVRARRYCPRHGQVRRLYYRKSWKTMRAQVLADHAYECAHCGRVQLRLEVDHIVRHAGDPRRFWDRQNLQALCPSCHVNKTKGGE